MTYGAAPAEGSLQRQPILAEPVGIQLRPDPGDAVHQLDLARYVMGDPPPPRTVTHMGGIVALSDGRDLPDTQYATYKYDNFTLLFQALFGRLT